MGNNSSNTKRSNSNSSNNTLILKVKEDDGSTTFYRLNDKYKEMLNIIHGNSYYFYANVLGKVYRSGKSESLSYDELEAKFVKLFRYQGYDMKGNKEDNVATIIDEKNGYDYITFLGH